MNLTFRDEFIHFVNLNQWLYVIGWNHLSKWSYWLIWISAYKYPIGWNHLHKWSHWLIWIRGFTWLAGLWISTCWKSGCGVAAALILLLLPSPMDSSLWSIIMSVSESSSMCDLPCISDKYQSYMAKSAQEIRREELFTMPSCQRWVMNEHAVVRRHPSWCSKKMS